VTNHHELSALEDIMRKFILPIFMAFLMGAATLGFIQIVRGQGQIRPPS